MEKWAKKLNAQKEHLKEEIKPPVAEPIIDISSVSLPSSATADAGFSMLEKVGTDLHLKLSSSRDIYLIYVFIGINVLAGLHKRNDFHHFQWKGGIWATEETIRLWW